MLVNRVAKKIGICEVSGSDKCREIGEKPVELWLQSHGMAMCEYCVAEEERLTAQNAENARLKQFVADSQVKDAELHLIQDVYNAKTDAAILLYNAIQENTDIPVAEKQYQFVKAMEVRYEALREVILPTEVKLNELKNEAAMWKTQLQSNVNKLSEKHQKEFERFHSNYKPVTKTVKPTAVTPKVNKKTAKEQFDAACQKYGMTAPLLKMKMVETGLSADDAAREFVQLRAAKTKQAN